MFDNVWQGDRQRSQLTTLETLEFSSETLNQPPKYLQPSASSLESISHKIIITTSKVLKFKPDKSGEWLIRDFGKLTTNRRMQAASLIAQFFARHVSCNNNGAIQHPSKEIQSSFRIRCHVRDSQLRRKAPLYLAKQRLLANGVHRSIWTRSPFTKNSQEEEEGIIC